MFESSLIPRRSTRRTRVVVLSFALHAVAAASAIGAAFWTVKAVEDPKTNDLYYSVRLPPPPADSSGERERPSTPTKPETELTRPEVAQPQEPDDETVAESEATSSEVLLADDPLLDGAGSDSGAGESGVGVDGGFSTGDGRGDSGPGVLGAVPQTNDDAPLHLTGAMTPPRLLPTSRVEPRYTEAARRVRLTGTVILEAVIDEQGEIRQVKVIQGLPLGLDQAAIDAVRHWRFEPARLGTRPVAVYFTLTIRFQLQ